MCYEFQRYPRTWQFERKPGSVYDVYYCGCQNNPDDQWEP